MAESGIVKGVISGYVQKDCFDDNERSFVGYASKEVLDRDGEIVKADAWELATYEKNPVVLLFHDHNSLPVARAAWTKRGPEGLQFKAIFANTPTGQEVYQLYKEGILNAFSCGFIAKEWDEGKNFKEDKYKSAKRVYTRAELLEISCVPVPSCSEALVERVSKGMIKSKLLDLSLKSAMESVVKTPEADNAEPETKPEVNKVNTTEKLVEEMPNEIRVRVKDPGLFEQDSFRRTKLKKDKPRVDGIIGKLKGETNTTIQSYRFPKDDGWTMADAKAWAKAHGKKDISSIEGGLTVKGWDFISAEGDKNKTVGLAGTPSVFDIIEAIQYALAITPSGFNQVTVEDIFPAGPINGACVVEIEAANNTTHSSYWHYEYRYDPVTETATVFNPVAVEEVYSRKYFISSIDKAGRELSAKNITVLQGCASKMHEAADMIDGLLAGKTEPKAVEPEVTKAIDPVNATIDKAVFMEAVNSMVVNLIKPVDVNDAVKRAIDKRKGRLD